MKYLVLIHNTPRVRELFAAMSDDERKAAFQTYWDVESDLTGSGELIDSKALDDGTQRLVRRTPDGPVSTAAPLPEVSEVVSGYYLVDVPNEECAVTIAARFPEAAVEGGMRVARILTAEDFARVMDA
jgi:hypothetical protein